MREEFPYARKLCKDGEFEGQESRDYLFFSNRLTVEARHIPLPEIVEMP